MARTKRPSARKRYSASCSSRAASWLGQTAVERALLIGACLLVLIVELLNSGIENVVDRVGHEHHRALGSSEGLGLGSGLPEPDAAASWSGA